MTTGQFLFDDTERARMVTDKAGHGHRLAIADRQHRECRGRRMTTGQPGSHSVGHSRVTGTICAKAAFMLYFFASLSASAAMFGPQHISAV
jgi:hypothetical protein